MIAVFDSGYGGLTVLKHLLKELPQYDYLYLGDNARAPYGNYNQDHITKFSDQAVQYLFNKGAKLIIFACNTASAAALRTLQQKHLKGPNERDRKILGVLIPVAEEAASTSTNSHIGLVATKATIQSQSYDKEIQKINSNLKLYSQACPLLVPFIEEGWQDKPEAISILKKYLKPLKSANISTLILGCTHYPFMLKHFKRIMGPKVKILESGPITATSLKNYLQRHPEIESKLSQNSQLQFLTTDDPQELKTVAEKTLQQKIKAPQKAEL